MAFRTLLFWLLAFAIPAQGFAASAMVFCAASHGRVVAAVESHDTATHSHADPAAHGHATKHTADMPVPGHGADPAGDLADKTPGTAASGQCSACADCCHQAVMATAPMPITATAPSPVYTAHAVRAATDALRSPLERPPRNDLG